MIGNSYRPRRNQNILLASQIALGDRKWMPTTKLPVAIAGIFPFGWLAAAQNNRLRIQDAH